MKKELQRIKIAEVCGWTLWPTVWTDQGGDKVLGWTPKMRELNMPAIPLPDYLNDLNEMREAVMSLSNTKFNKWAQELSIIVSGTKHKSPTRAFLCATAAQWAEAFLKTLNLWEE